MTDIDMLADAIVADHEAGTTSFHEVRGVNDAMAYPGFRSLLVAKISEALKKSGRDGATVACEHDRFCWTIIIREPSLVRAR